jgi:hypothetical protein
MSWNNDSNEDNVVDDGGTGDDQWTRDAGNGDTQDTPSDGREEYTYKTEREVAFKLIAAHALVDADFYRLLKDNPRDAIAKMSIAFEDENDYRYLEGLAALDDPEKLGVNWDAVDPVIDQIRDGLNAPSVVRSLW